MDSDTVPIPGGWRVIRSDGTRRGVFKRKTGEGWAVFDGQSTDKHRTPALGYGGSWHQDLGDAIEWARTVTS
jgi:hypothetical protein